MEKKLLLTTVIAFLCLGIIAQNVGIGTNNPTAKLDVNGTVKATGFRMNVAPSKNYVLRSDSVGNASWVDPVSITTNGVKFYTFNDTITATDTLLFTHPIMGWKVSYKLGGNAVMSVSNTNAVLNDDCIFSGVITNNNSPNTISQYLGNAVTNSISVTNNWGNVHAVSATVMQKHAPHGMKIEMSEVYNYISGMITYW